MTDTRQALAAAQSQHEAAQRTVAEIEEKIDSVKNADPRPDHTDDLLAALAIDLKAAETIMAEAADVLRSARQAHRKGYYPA